MNDLNNLFKIWQESLPPLYKDVTLESCDKLPKTLMDTMIAWSKSRPIRSLYLHGTYGSGKTTCAIALIRRLYELYGHQIRFSTRWIAGRELDQSLYAASRADYGDTYLLQKLIDTDLLYIDDIDKISPSARICAQLYSLLNGRYTHNKPTIITSNISYVHLQDLFDGAIISRFCDTIKWLTVDFPNKDLRKTNHVDNNPRKTDIATTTPHNNAPLFDTL